MRCSLNGAPHELADDAAVTDALAVLVPADLLASGRGIAVALDGAVVPRGAWSSTPLREGATLEVLTAVQGG